MMEIKQYNNEDFIMSNMSYCRFQNTLLDLQDCQDNLHDDVSSYDEYLARLELMKIAAIIANESDNFKQLTREEFVNQG